MENNLICGEEETLKIGYWIDKIAIPDPNYKWNKKMHYFDAPITQFQLILNLISLGY